MKPTRILLTAIGTLLLAAACQTEQLPTDGSPFAPGEERPLIITPVVSSAAATRSAADATSTNATSTDAATRATADPVSVTLIGGNLALTLSRDAAAAAPTQTAVYTATAPATAPATAAAAPAAAAAAAAAAAPLAYAHQATIDTLVARGICANAAEAAARARALYVTAAGE